MIKSKTKEEKKWLSDVAELGCICCRNMGFELVWRRSIMLEQGREWHSELVIQMFYHYALHIIEHVMKPAFMHHLNHGKKFMVARLSY